MNAHRNAQGSKIEASGRRRVVYVSSTFVDLQGHRAALKSALEKAQYDVECMEEYPAFDERPLDKCLADVARADVYVLLLAHRYGFRPEEGNPERKSITHLEYEEAGRHQGKPRLVFIVDADHDWKPKWIDKGDDAHDLEAFRTAVLNRHGVSQFTGPDQLASLVLQALRALETDEPSGAAESGATSWNWPRPWDFSPFMADKRRRFVGRKWLFDMVREWHGEADGPQALLLCADFGIGKSAFMAKVGAPGGDVPIAALHFCHHDTIETLNPATFVRNVAAQLSVSLPDYKAAVEADPEAMRWLDDAMLDPASAFERAVVTPLNTIKAPAVPQLLLVDALDEALDFEATSGSRRTITIVRLLAARARRLPAWLKILATSRHRQEVLQPMGEAFRCRLLDGEDVRNLEDIRAYVVERCRSGSLSGVLTRAGKRSSDLADFLSKPDQSRGKFLYAVRVLNDLESGALPITRLTDLPPGMDGFYLSAFERRFPSDAAYEVIRPLLAVLCIQREPLSSAQLSAILSISQKQIQSLLATLEDFLNVRNDKHYAFDHLSLSQWLIEENERGFARAGRFAVDRLSAVAQIADWARREVAADRAHQSEYLARHLGSYLSEQERNDCFTRLLFDFRWLDARLRAVGINALLSDWTGIEMTPVFEALARALRHAAHVLGHDDDWHGQDLLASQILGRLQHRTEPETGSLCAQAAGQIRQKTGLRPLTGSLQATDALLRTLEGNSGDANALAILADGHLASGSHDGTIKLWNPASGACETMLEGHSKSVNALAVLADGRLASGSNDGTIKLWNPASGGCEATLEGHSNFVNALAVLVDGRLASGSWDQKIKLWNPATGACEATLEGHSKSVSALAVLADGRLASGSMDGTIKLWNPVTGACETTLEGHSDWVNALAVLADGRLSSGSDDGTIKLWNPATGACEATLKGHSIWVNALAVLADGRLSSGSGDGTIELWNPVSGACETALEGHSNSVRALAALADGRLSSGSGDGTIKLWNPASGASEATFEGHSECVRAVAVLVDGRLSSGSDDGTIKLWNPASGACETALEGHSIWVRALAVLADGRLSSGSWDGTIKLWNPASGAFETTLEGHSNSVRALAVLADGRVASGSDDDTIKLWNPASSACEATLEGHSNSVRALAVLADGRLSSGSLDGTIKLWNPASGACEATLKGHSNSVNALVVLADGRLSSGSSDGTIKLWNPSSGACEATLEGHSNSVNALAVLADGRLASGSADKSIRIWSLRDHDRRGYVQFVGDAAVTALAIASDASVLVAGDLSGRIHFLRIEGMPLP